MSTKPPLDPFTALANDVTQTSAEPDLQTTGELNRYETERIRGEISKINAELEQTRQNTQERKKYAQRIFWMVSIWLVIILIMIVAVGLRWLVLSDTIVLGLIGSTTINVTAFFLSVTKYLFPNQAAS